MTTSSSQSERPLRSDARRNRERILSGARAVFAEYGSDAQMDDVARRAGVGVGTVYRHYPTKEALLVELVREKFRIFTAEARDALERDGEPFQVLTELMRSNAEALARDAGTQQVLAGAGEHIWTQAAAAQTELLELTSQLIDRARRAGTIRADATATDIGMLMCGLSATMAHPAPGFDWRRHLDLVVDMLRPR
ncbi:MAG TPA: helix-turn-helix domain-containing protein [Solirubrobacteraceae bacterium]|nr:helix-turn-helix domain-containing protein [Solirubrobacteraceae bacterium]